MWIDGLEAPRSVVGTICVRELIRLAELFAQDQHRVRGGDPQLHALPLDGEDAHRNAAIEHDPLFGLAGEDQHRVAPSGGQLRASLVRARGRRLIIDRASTDP